MDIDKYQQFVKIPASDATNYYDSFIDRVNYLHSNHFNVNTLLTAAIGIPSEGGEFSEIVKKVVFQNREYTPIERDKMIKELGDVLWYVTHACNALDVSIQEVIDQNVSKLTERYNIQDKKRMLK